MFPDRAEVDDHRQQQKNGGWLSRFGGGRARHEPPPLRDYRNDPTPVLNARAAAISTQTAPKFEEEDHADAGEDLEIPSFLRRLAN